MKSVVSVLSILFFIFQSLNAEYFAVKMVAGKTYQYQYNDVEYMRVDIDYSDSAPINVCLNSGTPKKCDQTENLLPCESTRHCVETLYNLNGTYTIFIKNEYDYLKIARIEIDTYLDSSSSLMTYCGLVPFLMILFV